MNCWMAPVIATEMWGISIEELYVRLKNGTIVSQMIGDFLLVKSAPEHDDCPAEKSPPERAMHDEAVRAESLPEGAPCETAKTEMSENLADQTIVTPRERAALAIDFSEVPEVDPAEAAVEELAGEEVSSIARPDISQWKRVRREIGCKRRPPALRAMAV